ncbi:hypothetical protein [Sanyastnella coralliicola]|uniref:hypothetical protein n=1 Tax=Sanyastnella coralliicola TaxID=3069118 RepID=UPI0027B90220|nr:hypothetical protein [Longitalea sp. SCSIO 12813]
MKQEESRQDLIGSWTIDLSKRAFLFTNGQGCSSLSAESLIEQCGLTRLSLHAGKPFSVISSPDPAEFPDQLISTRGIVLQENPGVISGTCHRISKKELEHTSGPSREELIDLLTNWTVGTPRNIVHALRAPISRIKGIEEILRSELSHDQEHEQLLDYLSASTERLSKLADHLISLQPGGDQPAVSISSTLNLTLDGFGLVSAQTPSVELDSDFFVEREVASSLDRLLINFLTYSFPGIGDQHIKVEKAGDNLACISLSQKIEPKQQDLAERTIMQLQNAPSGVLEFLSSSDRAMVISCVREGFLDHKIYLPKIS